MPAFPLSNLWSWEGDLTFFMPQLESEVNENICLISPFSNKGWIRLYVLCLARIKIPIQNAYSYRPFFPLWRAVECWWVSGGGLLGLEFQHFGLLVRRTYNYTSWRAIILFTLRFCLGFWRLNGTFYVKCLAKYRDSYNHIKHFLNVIIYFIIHPFISENSLFPGCIGWKIWLVYMPFLISFCLYNF
jgi:hypothetical protein